MFYPCFIYIINVRLWRWLPSAKLMGSWALDVFFWFGLHFSTKQRSKNCQRTQSKQQIYGVSTPWKLGNKSCKRKQLTGISCQNLEAPMTKGLDFHCRASSLRFAIGILAPLAVLLPQQLSPMTKRNILGYNCNFEDSRVSKKEITSLAPWLPPISQGFLLYIIPCLRLFSAIYPAINVQTSPGWSQIKSPNFRGWNRPTDLFARAFLGFPDRQSSSPPSNHHASTNMAAVSASPNCEHQA